MRRLPSPLEALLQLLSPPTCAACDLPPAHPTRPFCEACHPLLERPVAVLQPPHPGAGAFLYEGPMAQAVVRFKYQGRPDLARPLSLLWGEHIAAYAGRVDCVVPMPLHSQRLRQRGYNQALLLARPLAHALGVPLVADALRRVRPTVPQALLPRARRVANVRGAFAVRRVPRARVLLVDDVRTTGATLAAAADALQRAGCRGVRTLALARAAR